MKLRKKKWQALEDEKWVSFDEKKKYRNFLSKKNKIGNSSREIKEMDLEVHNQLGINYNKTLSTISFFAKSTLGKFAKKNKWKLEVWLDEENPKGNPTISCAVALVRPRRGTIYAKKVAQSLNEAIKKSVGILEKTIDREEAKWSH